MVTTKYSMSFTTGALFYHESLKLAAFSVSLKNWNAVRGAVISENVIQARTTNTLKRVTNEIISRLKTLSEPEIRFLVGAAYAEQGYLLWLAICRRYLFIADFAVDVLHGNFMSLNNTVTRDDYNAFFNRKAEWHSEVDGVAPSTKRKLRQTLFQMMQEARLVDKNGTIIPVIPSAEFQNILSEAEGREAMFFPISELGRRAK
jgi:hypothetical protein